MSCGFRLVCLAAVFGVCVQVVCGLLCVLGAFTLICVLGWLIMLFWFAVLCVYFSACNDVEMFWCDMEFGGSLVLYVI